MESKKSSVFTKGQVYSIFRSLHEDVTSLKSVKEVRECVQRHMESFKPQNCGRKLAIDTVKLQQCIDETAPKMVGSDAKNLACMVASVWNVHNDDPKQMLDTQRVKRLILTNKIKFPEGVVFVSKPRKPKNENIA